MKFHAAVFVVFFAVAYANVAHLENKKEIAKRDASEDAVSILQMLADWINTYGGGSGGPRCIERGDDCGENRNGCCEGQWCKEYCLAKCFHMCRPIEPLEGEEGYEETEDDDDDGDDLGLSQLAELFGQRGIKKF